MSERLIISRYENNNCAADYIDIFMAAVRSGKPMLFRQLEGAWGVAPPGE